jgi:hypothetical protein
MGFALPAVMGLVMCATVLAVGHWVHVPTVLVACLSIVHTLALLAWIERVLCVLYTRAGVVTNMLVMSALLVGTDLLADHRTSTCRVVLWFDGTLLWSISAMVITLYHDNTQLHTR